eukprot:12323543-Heterocapsa_arctica.AAC.1
MKEDTRSPNRRSKLKIEEPRHMVTEDLLVDVEISTTLPIEEIILSKSTLSTGIKETQSRASWQGDSSKLGWSTSKKHMHIA